MCISVVLQKEKQKRFKYFFKNYTMYNNIWVFIFVVTFGIFLYNVSFIQQLQIIKNHGVNGNVD